MTLGAGSWEKVDIELELDVAFVRLERKSYVGVTCVPAEVGLGVVAVLRRELRLECDGEKMAALRLLVEPEIDAEDTEFVPDIEVPGLAESPAKEELEIDE